MEPGFSFVAPGVSGEPMTEEKFNLPVEADHWAARSGSKIGTAEHVKQTLRAKVLRDGRRLLSGQGFGPFFFPPRNRFCNFRRKVSMRSR